jgi:uncharacterized membrane protein YphA (DoxX/SURF4 family)
MTDAEDEIHPLKAFAFGFGGFLALAAVFGVAVGPLFLFIGLSGRSGWWVLAAFTLGFAWLVGVGAAVAVWLEKRGWMPSSPYIPLPPPPPPFPPETTRNKH